MTEIAKLGKEPFMWLVELGGSFKIFFLAFVSIITGKFSKKEFIVQASKFGFDTLPVVAVVSFFIGLALTLQISKQLVGIGNTSSLGTSVAVSIVREIGPVVAGVMIAARIGGAMAAEIATMTVSEQVDALKIMKLNPINFLVAPRLLASLIMTPLLTVFAIYIGSVGGMLIAIIYVQLDPYMFFDSFRAVVGNRDILIALSKAFVNGALVATLSCTFGMETSGGAAGVGQTTTKSVVWAMLGIFLFNFLITNSVYSVGKVLDPAFVR
ncbi:MAG: ABC transporter permease [Candidatus Melainabacteria bacterium]|nr:ABC transporter permease [Candidatus Melainabacteria bacterium]